MPCPSRLVCPCSCFSWKAHPYFLLILSSYSSCEPQLKSHLFLEAFPEGDAPCSMLERPLVASRLQLLDALFLCIPVFVIQWTACSSRAQVLYWYFQVICNSGSSMSSLLNKQMGGVASAKAGAPHLATDIEAGQLVRWQD